MADIELVIKIPKDTYTDIIESGFIERGFIWDEDKEVAIHAIKNGTPLPKGHGRIGDLDALREEVSSWGMNDYEPSDFTDAIDQADTIIEADKAESEE